MQNRLIAPSTDFRAVRDGRNSQVYYVDVALDTARSAAAGTALVLPISGNAFYCDANPGDGNAYVHFQDTNFDRAPAPLYVSPGVIFNIPFTQVLIENTAQPGKKIRIAYGIDIDFQPGSVAQIAVTNTGGYTAVRPEPMTGFFNSVTAYAAATATLVFSAASNVNGAIIYSASINDRQATAGTVAFLAKATAPTSATDGDPILAGHQNAVIGTDAAVSSFLTLPQYIDAGLGVYLYNTQAMQAFQKTMRYKLL